MTLAMWAPHMVLLLSIGLMILCALIFKFFHIRYQRRSPLHGRRVGHLPGQQLLDRVAKHDQQIDTAMSIMYMSFPVMFMVWLAQGFDWNQVQFGVTEAMFAAGGVAMFAWGLRDYIRHYRAREKARDGLIAERVTGLQLNRLGSAGCIVMHDLPGEGFNVDHVVISPRGVYAVETKSFRKPRQMERSDNYRVSFDGTALRFPDFVERDAPAQAERQARWLARVLRESLGSDVPVIPALALPGWHVEPNEAVWRSAAVKVFSPMGNGAAFMAKPIERLDQVQRSLIAQALAVRYPEIP
jgi:hypothetical protein